MSTVWTAAAGLLEDDLTRYRWECDVSLCDGQPHLGNTAFHGRAVQQLPSGEWTTWLLQAGRGFGKSRTGAESLLTLIERNATTVDGTATEWLMAGDTYSSTREVMTNGPSGLVAAMKRKGIDFTYNRANGLITLSSGQRVHLKGGDDYDLARGLNLAGAWVDEVLTWKRGYEAWYEGLIPALRQRLSNDHPRVIATSTPKAVGAKLLRSLTDRTDGSVRVVRGSTFENEANLSSQALSELRLRYPEGSRLWRIELAGEWVEETEGALWSPAVIDDNRVDSLPNDLVASRAVVAVDPAVSSGADSDLTGIVCIVSGGLRADRQFYVVKDKTMRAEPSVWARTAILLAVEFGAEIVYESNQGGNSIGQVLTVTARDLVANSVILLAPRIRPIRATVNKAMRAQPVAAQYEMGRVHHVGALPELEEELLTWVPGLSRKSPDRLDALVHGVVAVQNTGGKVAGAF